MNKKLILLAGLSAVYGSTAQAATLCAHPESKGSCFGTIQAAVDAAAAGDTIKIKSGTYYEDVTVDSTKTGLIITGKKNSIIDADDSGSALDIDADDVTIMKLSIHNSDSHAIDVDADNVHIKGVHIRNASLDCINVVGDGAVIEKNRLQACGSGGVDIDGNDAIVRNNRITQADEDGINVSGDDAVVEKNRITHVTDDAVRIEGDDAIVARNKADHIDADGIEVDGADANVSRNKLTNVNNDGINVDGDNPQVTRNRIAHFNDDGVEIDCSTCETALVEANVVKLSNGESDDCFEIDASDDGTVVNKNIGQVCGDDGFDIEGDGDVLVTNNRSIDAGPNSSADGFDISGLGKKTLIKNQARGSSDDGFDISDGDEAVDPGDPEGEHVLENNKAIDNSDVGFSVNFDAVGTTLLNNKSTRNIANGISLFSDDNTVTGNKAKGNREGFDFCNEGSDSTLTGNKFGSESTECSPNP